MRHDAVDDLVGRPYAYGARGPDAFDCWGLVLAVRARLALPAPPDFASREVAPAQVRALVQPALTKGTGWTRCVPRHGAIAYAPATAHAGVLVWGRVIHAVYRVGVVAWRLGEWTARFEDAEFWELEELVP
jgi:cell wall-associated NlpC family hydrolase